MGLGLSREDAIPHGPVFTVRGRLYRTLDFIGEGSEATVYRCEDQNAAHYAVKVFHFSRFSPAEVPQRVKKFKKEATILRHMAGRSRHFVHLVDYEYSRNENVGYMIMELGDGSLRQQLVGVPLNDPVRRMYWKQIVTILRDLQDAQVVHADIKPDNLILVNNVVKLTDLGLAFQVPPPIQAIRRPKVRGTLDYMAPEVFAHQTGFKSDIWSAGIILYEMAYGRPPYFGILDRDQKAVAIASMTPIRFPPLGDRYLLDSMRRCLQSDSRRRPNAYQLYAHPYTRM